MSYQNGKDCLPEYTIQNIRDILISNGLFPHETFWASHAKNCYNLRLELDGFPEIGTNGKGISRPYALASAYGELMERLESGILLKQTFGLMKEVIRKYPDSRVEKLGETVKRLDNLFNKILEKEKGTTLEPFLDLKFTNLPYYHINSKTEVYLPELMSFISGSNGMCAGNTADEALVQGLSEIMERYVSKKIEITEYDFPDIPLEEVSNPTLNEMIADLQNKGYKIVIKDLTLGGVYPCLGVIIIDINTMNFFISLGAHPLFDIALQRCITEAFQVDQIQTKLNAFSSLFDNENINRFRQLKTGAHKGNIKIFESSKPSTAYKAAFVKSNSSNDEMLKFICSKLISMGYDIYIRNTSYLGFPSYRIYVNGMSEKAPLAQTLKEISSNFPLKKYLLNLKNCDVNELQILAGMFEELNDEFERDKFTPANKYREILGRCIVIFEPDTDFHILLKDIDYFLAILYSRLANYEKAYVYLSKYIHKQHGAFSGVQYYLCVLHFFRLKAQGKDIQEIRNILEPVYGTTALEVMDDVSVPEKAFQYFDLPSCGDCSHCSYNDGRCSYPNWKSFAQTFQQKVKNYTEGQNELVLLFDKLSII